MMYLNLRDCNLTAKEYSLNNLLNWFPELILNHFPSAFGQSILYIVVNQQTRTELFTIYAIPPNDLALNYQLFLTEEDFVDFFRENWCSIYLDENLADGQIAIFTAENEYLINL